MMQQDETPLGSLIADRWRFAFDQELVSTTLRRLRIWPAGSRAIITIFNRTNAALRTSKKQVESPKKKRFTFGQKMITL
jgi:hypothetical protein